MKTTTLLFVLLALPFVGGAQGTFELSGRIAGKNSGTVYLHYAKTWTENVRDSATIVKGAFLFRGKVDGAANATLSLTPDFRGPNPDVATFWIEAGKMTIELTAGNIKEYRLTGSRTNDENRELDALNAPVIKELQEFNARHAAESDHGKKNAIREQMIPLAGELGKNQDRFIREHPDSYLSAYLLLTFKLTSSAFSLEEGESLLAAMSERVKQSAMGKALVDKIGKLRAGSPGSTAALFRVEEDINGKPFDLASVVGKKYVLLDFWASWCAPCRQENPHHKELYQKYKKDLAIVCISDDADAGQWRAAVEQDGIQEFYHVRRGAKRGPDRTDSIGELYSIQFLPTRILVDKSGTIIARYITDGSALDARLKEIFGR
jgi:thiol-disulfide isomerase/thioredoxin